MSGMDGFLVPTGPAPLALVGPTMPRMMAKHVSHATKGMAEAEEITHIFGGRDKKPEAPILIWGPDGRVPILVFGLGVTEAAEMQDMAVEAIGHQQEMMEQTGRGMDFDQQRERIGAVPRAQVDQQMREAIQRRIDHHKANLRTDPFRQPRYSDQLGHVFGGVDTAGMKEKA